MFEQLVLSASNLLCVEYPHHLHTAFSVELASKPHLQALLVVASELRAGHAWHQVPLELSEWDRCKLVNVAYSLIQVCACDFFTILQDERKLKFERRTICRGVKIYITESISL